MRINKFLAHAGVAARRAVDRLITQGAVSVNGTVMRTLGTQIDPEKDVVHVNGKRVELSDTLAYVVINKPQGVLTTTKDPENRPTVIDLLPKDLQHLYPVGRLDQDSRGLVLLTNDGTLTHRLLHPRYHVPRVYEVKVWGHVTPKKIKALREGILLQEKKTLPADITLLSRSGRESWLRFVLEEGKHRQIRRMCGSLELEVLDLVRLALGPLSLNDLKAGKWRKLLVDEVVQLYEAVGLSTNR